MIRKTAILGSIMLAAMAFGQTTIPGGNVSGIWTLAGSPYNIEGEITISDGDSLLIDPGVDVLFQGHYMLIIHGTLIAEGNDLDSIKFTAVDTSEGWWGLRLYGSDACTLSYCTIEYARAFGSGGPEHIGGGLYSDTSSPVISHCRFTNNRATTGGGMGFMWYSNPTITNCLIDNNWAQWGGGIFADEYSRVRVLNCTVTRNTGVLIGGGIRGFLYCGYTIINTLVEGNYGAGGINLTGTIDDTIMYCDIYNNEGGDLVGSVPPDAGLLTATNTNGDSCDIYYNIFENPLFAGGNPFDYHLTENSPCIDAGDPLSPLDPDGTIADIGAYYFDQGVSAGMAVNPLVMLFEPVIVGQQGVLPLTIYSAGEVPLILDELVSSDPDIFYAGALPDSIIDPGDSVVVDIHFAPIEYINYEETIIVQAINAEQVTVTCRGSGTGSLQVTLTPYNPPIVIPASGGTFDFNVALCNHTPEPQSCDLWTVIFLPGVGAMEIMNVQDITLPGDTSVDRDREQTVPDYAPAGTYTYQAFIGDYPWLVEDSDSFSFEKEGGDCAGTLGDVSDWSCSGEDFREMADTEAALPARCSVSGHPNPFNPSTVISYTLHDASFMTLAIYDVTGREVARLVDGWRDAGVHEVTFDGTGLASGLYVYRLDAGEFAAQGKMILLK